MGKMAEKKAAGKRPPAESERPEKCKLAFALGTEVEMAEWLLIVLRESGAPPPVFDEGDLYGYAPERGIWRAIDHTELSRVVQSFDGSPIGTGSKDKPKTLKVSHRNVEGAIRLACDRVASPGYFGAAPHVLVFADRTLRANEAGQIEVVAHSPDHRARVRYDFNWCPKAKRPRFEKMLHEHFEGDSDADQKIACLQEFFGGCLFGMATRKQKCLALPSDDGASGRSTLLEIIDRAMPAGSVSHVEAKEMRRAERRATMPGKLLNYSDEVPSDAFLESEDFKKIVAGNIVTGEQKYKPSFEFRPRAGLVFPIQLSPAAEVSGAFFRRFIIIRYNRSFEGLAKRDYDLAAKIIATELPGVVAWMVEGAIRLLKQGYTIPPSHAQEDARWKLSTDTVRAFLDAEYTKASCKEPRTQGYDASGRPNGKPIKDHDWTPGSTLFSEYQRWCELNGHRKPVANPEFKRRVEKIGYPPVHTHKGNFFGVRTIVKAQKEADERAAKERTPLKPVKGAVSVLQGGSKLALLSNSNT